MYQYDVPQAERNAQLLSMDPLVLERLLGTDNLAQVLDTQVIDSVAGSWLRRPSGTNSTSTICGDA